MSRNARSRQNESSQSNTTNSSGRSDRSYQSQETTPTESSGSRPGLPQHQTCYGRVEGRTQRQYPPAAAYDARNSVETYASTSEEDLADDYDDYPEYDVPDYPHDALPDGAIPTTPRDFADLFPTAKRISIRHDDSTLDGNMNLRVDTQIEERNHRKQSYTLFHLRMKDLRTREFSLRRYCRDSGREVCHSIRKYQKPPSEVRPVLQRASTALASLVHKPDSRPTTSSGLKRSDSGYESMNGWGEEDDSRPKSAGYARGRALIPTNTIKLEFSNYAHVDVKRRGAKTGKRYSFEYWGHDYYWKRRVSVDRNRETVSYCLVRADAPKNDLAHISPVRLTDEQAEYEAARGGWIPPSYPRITDEETLGTESDFSDVIVATGLIALVDDCIKRRFHSKRSTLLHIPLVRNASFKLPTMEYVGPKRLIDEVFNRRAVPVSSSRRPASSRRTTMEA